MVRAIEKAAAVVRKCEPARVANYWNECTLCRSYPNACMMNVFPPAPTRELHHLPTDFTVRRNTNGTKTKRITGHTHIETEAHLLYNNSSWGWTCTIMSWSPLRCLEAARCTRFAFSVSMKSLWRSRSRRWRTGITAHYESWPSEEARLDTGEWLASHPGHVTPVESAPIFDSIVGWLGSTADLRWRNISPPARNQHQILRSFVPYPSHYYEWATRFS
jgi:hypothetical protein